MAREGLRTLVVGRKRLSQERYHEFSKNYKQASLSLSSRDTLMAKVVHSYLECDLELLGVTGVEDKLQKDVKPSLELLRNAGVKIWMLTGDKIETARCVAVSSKLVSRGQYIHTVSKLKDPESAQEALDFLRNKTEACLLIDGDSLTLMLSQFRTTFISIAVLLPTVIACRCSPTQKAEIALLIRRHTKKRVCCIGDGGNDVSMIQAADVGIGIVGKEGRQASLAADFSITQFHHLTKLLVWHGRNSYKRSAKLAQFIMHRGLIISACQTMYSIAKHFEPKGLFINWLLVGYATVYTNAPVFSLVLDRDVDEELANLYPELYKELKSGRSLSYRSFFTWVLVSVYQGSVIQGFSQILVDATSGPRLISVSFTALVLNELAMVAISITTWHPIMIFCIIGTGLVYAASVPFLGDYFDLRYVVTVGWVWRVAVLISRTWSPPNYRKNCFRSVAFDTSHIMAQFSSDPNWVQEKCDAKGREEIRVGAAFTEALSKDCAKRSRRNRLLHGVSPSTSPAPKQQKAYGLARDDSALLGMPDKSPPFGLEAVSHPLLHSLYYFPADVPTSVKSKGWRGVLDGEGRLGKLDADGTNPEEYGLFTTTSSSVYLPGYKSMD
ncbi:transporter protein [Coccidioides immitis RMSCC 3703]|uniref:Phospholipid-transporting ATPase n=1 Tax=Coccidioides immitis RMSCC 3703 TaxID=454286 RepID=A0A0J8QXX2_COCIT|nr:transporter protein [Coccidioides immitis RMSCC 3703]